MVITQCKNLDADLGLESAFYEYPDMSPFNTVHMDLRIKGIRLSNEMVERLPIGKIHLQMTDDHHYTLLGAKRNPNSPYFFDGTRLYYHGNEIVVNGKPVFDKVELSHSGPRPDFRFWGYEENGSVNPEALLGLCLERLTCTEYCKFCIKTHQWQENRRQDRSIKNQEVDYDRIFTSAASVTKTGDLSQVRQLSIVTGISRNLKLHPTEELLKIFNEAHKRAFNGRLLYAGYQLTPNDVDALERATGNFIWHYTIECFTKREIMMPSKKGKRSVEEIIDVLHQVKDRVGKASFFYIAGIDDLEVMKKYFEELSFCEPQPNINLFRFNNSNDGVNTSPSFGLKYALETTRLVRKIFYRDTKPEGVMGIGHSGLWQPKRGIINPDSAYILRENLPYYSGEELGRVKIIN